MDLSQAIAKHSEWKMKFRKAITNHEPLDATSISKDNCCELGTWLHAEAKSHFSALPSYSALLAKHAEFHVQAGVIARAINAKDFTKAETMLAPGTPYDAASNNVAVAIMRFKTEASL